jgi:hypothetical protein
MRNWKRKIRQFGHSLDLFANSIELSSWFLPRFFCKTIFFFAKESSSPKNRFEKINKLVLLRKNDEAADW